MTSPHAILLPFAQGGVEIEERTGEDCVASNGFCPDWIVENILDYLPPFLEHIYLTVVSVGIGFALAFGLALLAHRKGWTFGPISGFTQVLYTIPSIAAFFLLQPITDRGNLTAIIALVAYTLFILFSNIMTGLGNVPDEVKDSARGMGLTDRQLLWRVELPLAVPEILAGLRIATTTTIGLATLAFLAGGGGLGVELASGADRVFKSNVAIVGVLATLLAAAFDLLILAVQKLATPWQRPEAKRRGGMVRALASLLGTALRPLAAVLGSRIFGRGLLVLVVVAFVVLLVVLIGPLTEAAAGFVAAAGDAINFVLYPRESVSEGVMVGGTAEMIDLTLAHLLVSAVAVVAAVALFVPLGLYLGHKGRGEFLAISASNIGRAVPSLALMAFFIAYLGIGFANVATVLFLLAIPPILTNTYVGVRQVEREAVDAARGMGMTDTQIVTRVELPLALPTIFAGIRLSAVAVLATAIIAPLANWPTLGTPITEGQTYGPAGQLGAAIVVALVTLAGDGLLRLLQRAVTPGGLKAARTGSRRQVSIPTPTRREQTA